MNKIKKNDILEKIKNILLKKAEGYFYNEETLEFSSPNEKSETSKIIEQKRQK